MPLDLNDLDPPGHFLSRLAKHFSLIINHTAFHCTLKSFSPTNIGLAPVTEAMKTLTTLYIRCAIRYLFLSDIANLLFSQKSPLDWLLSPTLGAFGG